MLPAVSGHEEFGSQVGSDGLINFATNSSRATWPTTARQDGLTQEDIFEVIGGAYLGDTYQGVRSSPVPGMKTTGSLWNFKECRRIARHLAQGFA